MVTLCSVLRGGCWYDQACRVAFRNLVEPDITNRHYGFRVVNNSTNPMKQPPAQERLLELLYLDAEYKAAATWYTEHTGAPIESVYDFLRTLHPDATRSDVIAYVRSVRKNWILNGS